MADGGPGGGAGAAGGEARAVFDPAASAGLFVGVSSFEDERIASVPFAVDDAVDLAHLFAVELGLVAPQRVVLLLAGEPGKPESTERLAQLLQRGARRGTARQREVYRYAGELARGSGTQGLLVVAAATHGVSDQGGDFLVATDSLKERTLRTGVAVAELFDEVARAGAERRLVLLDACRERLSHATRGEGDSAMAQSFADAIARATGLVVLSGATLGGFAYDDRTRGNGVFTAALLDGLRGAASAGPEGWITVRTLADFVQQRVAAWVRLNRPDHAARSLGIERRIASTAEALPLAPHPAATRERQRYRERREAALAQVRENQGRLLRGAHWDLVDARLPPEGPPDPEAERLLEEIEALDGSERAQRSLRDLVRELSEGVSLPSAPKVRRTARNEKNSEEGPRRAEPTQPTTRRAESPAGVVGQLATDGWKKAGRRTAIAAGAALFVIIALCFSWLAWKQEEQPSSQKPEPAAIDPAGPRSTEVETAQSQPQLVTQAAAQLDNPQAGESIAGPLGMRLRFVPSGTYTIGSPADEQGRDDHETWHEVELTRGFWLAETELTQAQWRRLVTKNPSHFRACGGDCPVENVNWYEAVAFANLLSDQQRLPRCYGLKGCSGTLDGGDFTCESASFTGLDCRGYRLPTEAEWEVAARAGTMTAIHSGGLTLRGERDAPELDPIAWYGGNSGVRYSGALDCSGWRKRQHAAERCGPHPVGQKQANAWGFRDMLGNANEWTGDWYAAHPTGSVTDPVGPSEGTDRVFRGGSWRYFAQAVRAAFRGRSHPANRQDHFSFRLVRGQDLRTSGRSPGS